MGLQQVLVSSSVSGLLVGSICTPFDVVKNFWQFNPACEANRANLTSSHVVRLLYRQQGLAGFWRGVIPAYATIIPANVTFFFAYERRRPDESPAWAGIKARAAAVVVTAPMELIRTRMQASIGIPGQCRTIRQVLAQLVQLGGVSSLWKGVLPTLVRDLPFSAIYWQTAEYMKAWGDSIIARNERKRVQQPCSPPVRTADGMPEKKGESNLQRNTAGNSTTVSSENVPRIARQRDDKYFSSLDRTGTACSVPASSSGASSCCSQSSSTSLSASPLSFSSSLYQSFVFPFFSGAVASAIACVVTHPFDVLKTNVQAGCQQIEPHARKMGYIHLVSRGFVDVARTVYAQQGLRGFTVGLTPRLLKIVPSCAVLLASYEVTKYLYSESLLDSM
ncbi:putative mitochondrial carrier family protein [Neospora caninum Liverpool]|uniref:Mitochondrial carrier family protein, putative n=1 Tax=Neospora caninum (strain Liverpool) TaxID=572307 RepID=F0VQK6_NEOCL|nr:putative mitochondrial carrier family protein [Neospora caninum Liverpool]CBZ56003.1 putative mitochondrial carrier family protein [Neospora caninum Liverpool]CEL70749.1 TPA: mitochondrial carrier family protein, putative [Neospora caninum Liverpool]|eukprot:XP_003886029.1 putative mitochondrial carrier family protein [Neospora caninum Liverpool]